MIVFFNREEDGLLGSSEFVAHLARRRSWPINEAHIFEMVGYRDQAPGSQTVPPGLPIRTRDVLGGGGCHSRAWEFASLRAEAPCTLQPAAAVASRQLVSGRILVEHVRS